MKIDKIDENFIVNTNISEPDMVWYDARQFPFEIYGVIYDKEEEKFLRMPKDIAEKVSKEVAELNTNTSGGRVRFKTDSSYIAISAVMNACWPMPHMPVTGMAGFDIYRNDGARDVYFRSFVPSVNFKEGYSSGIKTLSDFTDYTINFPLYHDVKRLYIGIKKDAALEPPTGYRHKRPIVYYGNSITQGGCASRPGNSYPGLLSRRLSTDFINLGFSGSGKGEIEMAEYIAGLDMSVLVMDYDANAPTVEHLRKTHYPFYKTIRDKNPDLPIILISHTSAIYGAYYYKSAVSEKWGDFASRKAVIKETYDRAVSGGDKNIFFIDGSDIFSGEEWDAATVDGTHPNDFGFFRFAIHLEKYLKPLVR